MIKWFKNIFALAILVFLVWYIAQHWEELKVLLKFSFAKLAVMYILCFLVTMANGRIVQYLTNVLKAGTGFWDMVLLHNIALLLNYAPMKMGTLFRANYLKRHYGLAYTHFASFFLYITFLTTAIATLAGLITLLVFYGLKGYESKILAAAFAITAAGSLCFLFLPFPQLKDGGRIREILRGFFAGRSLISEKKKTLFAAAAFSALTFILTAIRLGIIYNGMGRDIHPAGYLILGTLDFVVVLVSLTPGSLGVRELVLGSCAVVLGVPLKVGILAAVIDRAVLLSYTFVVGGICAAGLRHKSPADFKKQQNNCSL